MKDVRDLVPGDFVELADGSLAEIESMWGIGEGGALAAPSKGGFGVVTKEGQRVSMWEAREYHKRADLEIGECMFCHKEKLLDYEVEITARWKRGAPASKNGNACEECAVQALEDLIRVSNRRAARG